MEEPLKLLLAQMKAKKFQHEDEGIHVHLFADGVITKLIKVLICLAIGIEVIDKLSKQSQNTLCNRWYLILQH